MGDYPKSRRCASWCSIKEIHFELQGPGGKIWFAINQLCHPYTPFMGINFPSLFSFIQFSPSCCPPHQGTPPCTGRPPTGCWCWPSTSAFLLPGAKMCMFVSVVPGAAHGPLALPGIRVRLFIHLPKFTPYVLMAEQDFDPESNLTWCVMPHVSCHIC